MPQCETPDGSHVSFQNLRSIPEMQMFITNALSILEVRPHVGVDAIWQMNCDLDLEPAQTRHLPRRAIRHRTGGTQVRQPVVSHTITSLQEDEHNPEDLPFSDEDYDDEVPLAPLPQTPPPRRRQSNSRATRTVRPTPSYQHDEQSEQEARTYQVQRLPLMTNKNSRFTYYIDEESEEPCPPPKKDKTGAKIAMQPHISSREENEAVSVCTPVEEQFP